MKAYYDQNRELILASKEDQYQANPKAKRDISRINSCRKRNSEVGVFAMFGCNMSYTQGTDVLYRVRVFGKTNNARSICIGVYACQL